MCDQLAAVPHGRLYALSESDAVQRFVVRQGEAHPESLSKAAIGEVGWRESSR